MRRLVAVPFLAALTLAAAPAAAHTYGAHGAGFAAGLAHPIGGSDHLLAMVAVGIWATQLGGRALWIVPGAFIAAMVGGAILAMAGIAVPASEFGIVLSLIVVGLLVAGASRVPLPVSAVAVAFLAIFHGQAHGSEMPEAISTAGYAAGFVIATAGLHAVGIAVGRAAAQLAVPMALRFAGTAVAAAGLTSLVALT